MSYAVTVSARTGVSFEAISSNFASSSDRSRAAICSVTRSHAGEVDRLRLVVGQPNLGREVFVYEVGVGAGIQEVVSIVHPDVVFEHGLCTEAIMGGLRADPTADQPQITPERFQENAAFVAFLRELIAAHIFDIEGLQLAGRQQREGYVYLIDARTPQPEGQIPPVGVIGGINVQGGTLVPGSYQHNPNHRLLTENGLFRLPAELESVLLDELHARCARRR